MTDAASTQASAALWTVSAAVAAIGSLQSASVSSLRGLYTTVYAASSTLGALATGLDAGVGPGVGTTAGVDPDEMAAFITAQTSTCQDETLTLSVKDNVDLIGKNILLVID